MKTVYCGERRSRFYRGKGRGVLSTDWDKIYTDEDGDNEGKAVDLQSKAGGLYQKGTGSSPREPLLLSDPAVPPLCLSFLSVVFLLSA